MRPSLCYIRSGRTAESYLASGVPTASSHTMTPFCLMVYRAGYIANTLITAISPSVHYAIGFPYDDDVGIRQHLIEGVNYEWIDECICKVHRQQFSSI